MVCNINQTTRRHDLTVNDDRRWQRALEEFQQLLAVTEDGKIAILQEGLEAEDFIVACLVGAFLANKTDRTDRQTMSVDEIVAAGGLIYRPARQTLYNNLSKLSKSGVIKKKGKEFFVDERVFLQFSMARLPQLRGSGAERGHRSTKGESRRSG